MSQIMATLPDNMINGPGVHNARIHRSKWGEVIWWLEHPTVDRENSS